MPSALSPSGLVSQPERLREIWAFLTGIGVALMVLGAVTIGSSFIATLTTMMVFGILLLLGALFQTVTALSVG